LSKVEKRLWRTLVRIENYDFTENGVGVLIVVIPAWNAGQQIGVITQLPANLVTELKEGLKYLYADVNIGAEKRDDLIINSLRKT